MDVDRQDGPDPIVKRARAGVQPAVVVGGGILLTLGVAMWLDRSDLAIPGDLRIGRLFGPIALIAIGAAMMVNKADGDPRTRNAGTGGVWLIGIGAWMIASQTHLFGLTYGNSWPLFIILAGIIMVIRGAR